MNFELLLLSIIGGRVQQPEPHKLGGPTPSLEEPYEAEAPRTVLKPSLSSNGA